MHIVITGNIGCGKSTFTKMLMGRLPGYTLYDVDAEIHQMYNNETYGQIMQAHLGTSIRAEVSDIVFVDPEKLAWLEDLSRQFLFISMNTLQGMENVVYDFPLYYEEGGQASFKETIDLVITIHCSPETQMERIMERGRFTSEKAAVIVSNQFSHAMKAALADVAVSTDCTLDEVAVQAAEIAGRVKILDLKQRFQNSYAHRPTWDAIVQQYTEPHRFYHGMNHLAHLFEQYDTVQHLVKNKLAVETAIWFHDFVFESGDNYPLNEARSAQAMWELMSSTFTYRARNDAPAFQIAAEFIMATKGHKITSPYILARPDLLADCQLFLDIDLSSLGMGTTAEVLQSNDLIRKEFSQYNDLEFAQGRFEAMSSFGSRPQLFQSAAFAHLEEPAKHNIKLILAQYAETIKAPGATS